MEKKIYSQPMTKILSLEVSGKFCETDLPASDVPVPEQPLYGPPAPKSLF